MIQNIDGINFKIKEPYNFSFLNEYGKVFKVFDDQDSGNICFGVDNGVDKYFIKFGGAKTSEYEGSIQSAVERLKYTVNVYNSLQHNSLISFITSFDDGAGFATVFKWVDAEGIGRMYPDSNSKFLNLPISKRLNVFNNVMDFFEYTISKGFVAIDFYDGSILYNFDNDQAIICDIDFFEQNPVINKCCWGSSLFKAPEENIVGETIDEITNVYTLGAFAFALFGKYKRNYDSWQLNENLFNVAQKATSNDRNKRYKSIVDFKKDWNNSI